METAIGVFLSFAKSIIPLPITTISSNWLESEFRVITPKFNVAPFATEKGIVFDSYPRYEITICPDVTEVVIVNLPSKSLDPASDDPFTNALAPGKERAPSVIVPVILL
ncbi:hypothetical protein D3C85_921030 [compost metagenome]